MKISTTTETLARLYGEEKAIVKLAEAGFDAMDYSAFIHDAQTGIYSQKGFDKYARRLKIVAEAAGIEFGQIHAQIPSPSEPDYRARQALWDELAIHNIITASILECPYVVFHPIIMMDRRYDRLYRENFDLNVEYFGKMQPYLKEYGVKVAVENMWHWDDEKKVICPSVCSSPEELLLLCETLGDTYFDVCLDVGHTVLTDRTPESMVYALKQKLQVLHVHDNDGIDDTHDCPFNGRPIYMMTEMTAQRSINWEAFMKALHDVGYAGTLSLEADSFVKKFPEPLRWEAAAFMAKVARYLASLAQ